MENTVQVIAIPIKFTKSFLLKGERSILVDTGMPGSFEFIRRALEENHVAPGNVSLIVITHCHGDHFGDIARVKEYTGAQVAIHRLEGELLERGENAPVRGAHLAGKVIAFIGRFFAPKPAGVKPDILIDDELSLDEFGIAGKVVHTPGHTWGSVSVVIPGQDVFVGDLLMSFNEQGLPSFPVFAVDMREVRKSFARLLGYSPSLFHPSHGGPGDAGHVRSLIEKEKPA